MDLDAYLRRIGYEGPREPTRETLLAIHALHPQAIPFENLDPFAGETPSLRPDAVEAKLVHGGRGGWCFEQNLLFSQVLAALGFSFRRLAARVRWNVAPGTVTPRSHCLLLVEIEGKRWIADVGFGGLVLTAPLLLDETDVIQETWHEAHRLRETGEGFRLEALVAGDWKALYDFDLGEAQLADYEVSNWYLANNPQSHFVTGIVAARAEPGRRHALRGTRYSIHETRGKTEHRFASSAQELIEWLEGPFGIRVPRSPRLEAKLGKMIEVERTRPPIS
ncbi:MAG TPA: arylamine N-acetyltransferase [Usitatibacter sp.]|nr:arylamine N-acetyltransferase [Usitatibacter sp.]